MVHGLVADESGISNLVWAFLAAAAAIAALVYLPQLGFLLAPLGHFWSWLILPMLGG